MSTSWIICTWKQIFYISKTCLKLWSNYDMAKSVLIMIYWRRVGKRWVGKRRRSEYGGTEMHPVGITGIGIRSKNFMPEKNAQTNSEAWIFIKFQCVFIMDSTWQALQYNGKPFSNFRIIFRIYYIIQIIVTLGSCMRGGEAFVLKSTRYSWTYFKYWFMMLIFWQWYLYINLIVLLFRITPRPKKPPAYSEEALKAAVTAVANGMRHGIINIVS